MTTDTPQRQPLDFASARSLPPEQAAFFHLGEPNLVTEGVAFFPALGNSSAFLGERGILIVDTAQERFTPAVLSGLRAKELSIRTATSTTSQEPRRSSPKRRPAETGGRTSSPTAISHAALTAIDCSRPRTTTSTASSSTFPQKPGRSLTPA
jgi:hypothetical protein